MPKFQDLSGQRFGRLTVVKRVEDQVSASGRHKTQYLCKCDCGNQVVIAQTHLKDGHARSCGCLNSELSSKRLKERSEGIGVTHGKYLTGIYKSYDGIIERCVRTDNHRYKGRGIKVCPEWYNPDRGNRFDVDSFRNFYNWSMINGYEEGKSIDRIDNDGDYCPDNCRWATVDEQSNNKSNNHYIEYDGVKGTISEFASVFGYNYDWYYAMMYHNNFNPYNGMRPVMTEYGFPVYMYLDSYGNPIPMNCIYFINQYGHPVSESQYVPPAPQPALWACDNRGFITGPILD